MPTPALLIVDTQIAVLRSAYNVPAVIANIALALSRARAARVPILFVQHSDPELPHGSPGWQIVPELTPLPSEPTIYKLFNSAFEQTSLHDHLTRLGVTHIYLAGASTNWCIRATAHAALERGYNLTLLQDAHTTEDLPLPDGSSIPAPHLIHELNTALTYLSYPHRTTTTIPTQSLQFP